jgi:molybdenum cofactor synthesis domain-containing protein
MTASHSTDLERLRHPDEALETVLSFAHPLETELVPLAEAAWRVLAHDLIASESHPPFPASTMDGYAVLAADVSPWREVLGVQNAGDVIDAEVTDGYTVKIMTGAPVPRGADAVVKVENSSIIDDHVVITQEVITPGENIRPVGVDIKEGDLLVRAGARLGPAEIGLVAGMGINPVEVVRKPRVSVISTGDELVEPGQPLGPGQIRDSNSYSLMTALIGEGAEVVWRGKAPDERTALERLLRERIAESDIVITSGGVSMGDLDLVKELLFELATVHFQRLMMKPGKPLNFATAGNTLMFGLPGNPVSALAGFELFLRPALGVLSGRGPIPRPRVSVTLDGSLPPTDRIEYVRGFVYVGEDGRLHGRANGSQGSSRLASFAGGINALLIVPIGTETHPSGETIDALLLGAPLAAAP